MLHILMSSPIMCDFQALLRAIEREDELLLLSDGVIAGVVDSIFYSELMVLTVDDIIIYVLEDDVRARGLFDCISKKICFVNYMDFVALTEKHNLCISW